MSRCTSPTEWAAQQSPADLACDPQGLGHGQPSLALQPMLQALAPESLHHQVGSAALLADLVDRDDVVVLERGRHLGLAEEADPHQRTGHLGLEHFHRHPTPQDRIFRLEDQAHPAGAEQAEDPIPGESAPLVRAPWRVEDRIRVDLDQRFTRWSRIRPRQIGRLPDRSLLGRDDRLPIRRFRRRQRDIRLAIVRIHRRITRDLPGSRLMHPARASARCRTPRDSASRGGRDSTRPIKRTYCTADIPRKGVPARIRDGREHRRKCGRVTTRSHRAAWLASRSSRRGRAPNSPMAGSSSNPGRTRSIWPPSDRIVERDLPANLIEDVDRRIGQAISGGDCGDGGISR